MAKYYKRLYLSDRYMQFVILVPLFEGMFEIFYYKNV